MAKAIRISRTAGYQWAYFVAFYMFIQCTLLWRLIIFVCKETPQEFLKKIFGGCSVTTVQPLYFFHLSKWWLYYQNHKKKMMQIKMLNRNSTTNIQLLDAYWNPGWVFSQIWINHLKFQPCYGLYNVFVCNRWTKTNKGKRCFKTRASNDKNPSPVWSFIFFFLFFKTGKISLFPLRMWHM